MAIKITKLSPFVDKRWPATCLACKTEFTYQYPDIETTVFVPHSLYAPLNYAVRCPYCGNKLGVKLPEIDENGR